MNPYHRHHLANSALNPTHSYLIDDRSKSVTSSNNKDDFPLSDSSDETKNSTMEILDNLIEQLPKSSSIIAKKNQMCSVNGLSDDQPHIDVIKFDTNMLQQSSIEAEYDPNVQSELGFCGWILTILSYILIFLTLPISVCMCVKVVQEYERVVIFRLGRLMPGGAKGPGIFFIVPCIDTYRKVDLRVISFEVPPQEILSKDSVTVAVDAVVYFRISNASVSVTNVEDAARSTKLLAQTTLRNILGTKTLTEMLSDREAISLQMQISFKFFFLRNFSN
ncbi:SPFH domain / Band 7 family protein [Acanthocheilonema viteae]